MIWSYIIISIYILRLILILLFDKKNKSDESDEIKDINYGIKNWNLVLAKKNDDIFIRKIQIK